MLQESVSLMAREIQYPKKIVSEIENTGPRGSASEDEATSEQEVVSSEPVASALKKGSCPIPNCGKTFKRSDGLHRHVKSKMEREHIRLAEVWEKKHCKQCDKHFSRDCDFIRHQNSNHPPLSEYDIDSRIGEGRESKASSPTSSSNTLSIAALLHAMPSEPHLPLYFGDTFEAVPAEQPYSQAYKEMFHAGSLDPPAILPPPEFLHLCGDTFDAVPFDNKAIQYSAD